MAKESFLSLFKGKPKEAEESNIKEKEKKNPLIQDTPLKLGSQMECKYLLRVDSMREGIEPHYYWVLRFLEEHGFYGLRFSGKSGRVEKIKDLFSAAETSSYWGMIEQRKATQQEKAGIYLKAVSDMVKALFQILRELRIIDERIEYYNGYNKGDDSSSVALKSVWVDMVEGGARNPSSVTGLASQVGFVILPDLFYKIHPRKADDVDKEINKLAREGINRKIREVLGRKLKQFLIWKEKTEQEIKTRRNFVLKYLRQHFNVIKLYMNWIRPYLRNIKRLQMKETFTDKDIISSFETSKIELELLAVKYQYDYELYYGHSETKEFKKWFPVLLVKFNYVAMPQMAYQQEYQRGAIHMGRTEIVIEAFVVTKEQIEDYKKKVDEEDMELLASIDASIEALKDDLFKYLEEAGEIIKKEEESKRKGLFAPFSEAVSGFKEAFSGIFKFKTAAGEKISPKIEVEEKRYAKSITNDAFVLYDVFKKAHDMLSP